MLANNQPLFDHAQLEEGLDAECAAELSQCFLDDTGAIMELMQEAVAAKNTEAVRASAHKLRGACRSINAQLVENESSALEDAANDGNWEGITAYYGPLKSLYAALCSEISAYLKKA
jgi:HPt (histidine-containing phosphotransfer) domain-containing protein